MPSLRTRFDHRPRPPAQAGSQRASRLDWDPTRTLSWLREDLHTAPPALSALHPLQLVGSRPSATAAFGGAGSAESLVLGLCGSSSDWGFPSRHRILASYTGSLIGRQEYPIPRCGNSRLVMKRNRSDTTKRRRRDMSAYYTPNSPRHRQEPQSPNTRDSALPPSTAPCAPSGSTTKRSNIFTLTR
jgi:hypothetical protein